MDATPIIVLARNAAPLPMAPSAPTGSSHSFSSIIAMHRDSDPSARPASPKSVNAHPVSPDKPVSRKSGASSKPAQDTSSAAKSEHNPAAHSQTPQVPGATATPAPAPETAASQTADGTTATESASMAAMTMPSFVVPQIEGGTSQAAPAGNTEKAKTVNSKSIAPASYKFSTGSALAVTTSESQSALSNKEAQAGSDSRTLPTRTEMPDAVTTPETGSSAAPSDADQAQGERSPQFDADNKSLSLTTEQAAARAAADRRVPFPLSAQDRGAKTETRTEKTGPHQSSGIDNEPASELHALVSEIQKTGVPAAHDVHSQVGSAHAPLAATERSSLASKKLSVAKSPVFSDKAQSDHKVERSTSTTDRSEPEKVQAASNDNATPNTGDSKKQLSTDTPDSAMATHSAVKAASNSDTPASGIQAPGAAMDKNLASDPGQAPKSAASSQHPAMTAPAPTSATEPGLGIPGVSSAKLIERLGQSELTFGMKTRDLGQIEVSASMDRHQVSATISVERGDLGRALATELPALEKRLGDLNILHAKIAVHEQPTQMSNGSDHRSPGQQSHATAPSSPQSQMEREIQAVASIPETWVAEGLSIRI